MGQRKQAKTAARYLRRAAEDDYVQKQLQEAATRLRQVYSRGTREGGKAAEDKKVYRKIREAATSIRRAAGAIEEPPPKPKRRGRLVLGLASAVIAVLLAKRATKAGEAVPATTGPGEAQTPQAPQQEIADPISAS